MKTLKFLGIALLACGLMFTSCKKDNPKPDNNDNTTENPGGGGSTTPTNGAAFTIENYNTNWTANNIVAVDRSSQNYLYMQFNKTENMEGVHVSGYLQSVTGTYDYTSSQGDGMFYNDPADVYVDETGALGEILQDAEAQPGDQYNAWLSLTGGSNWTETITAIDLNALTMSATFTQKIVRSADVVAAGGVPETKYNLNGTLTNANWTWYSSKNVASKKESKQALAVK